MDGRALLVAGLLSALPCPVRADHYATLGVPRTASSSTIKQAYKKQALLCHPDKIGKGDANAAEERFRRVQEAYEVLSDKRSRTIYDLQRQQGGMPSGTGSFDHQQHPQDPAHDFPGRAFFFTTGGAPHVQPFAFNSAFAAHRPPAVLTQAVR
eukprot:CAMPEP_0183359956 /NCGR_PEP_ID=MMETSP0164_2-20130417/53840_1 /TAXON_ID=221442 /ORGANISM="Coccolithus pelagicus ssp braarudi, Strain PLY182g" /LENGTH=152 /DNA_ID=CAMNT_0025534191 /DNA_START=12 /DNA_END=467 /DNA_ORIENTATION=+